MKTENELFKEEYDNCIAEDISTINVEGFIEYCEEFYKMSTQEFQKRFEENNFEGNPDQQMWYRITKIVNNSN